ncbi:MAG: rubrerythrin family protein [Firmicutes bacterium HGW-Firmicutes-21]|nr:MAG: rubrerythrin family protein [Firmicutes bacterium HGW-Firmicutes-21]
MYQEPKSIQLPLLGNLTRQQLKETVLRAIVDEATAAEFYTRLLKEAPDDLHYGFIDHARKDELEHLGYFERLYYCLFRTKPQYCIEKVQYPSYKEGVLMALKDELEAAEVYRDVQLSVKEQLIKDVFYHAMVDELEHATQFSTLYNQLD